ncbi:hypothetical protein EVAR_61997_1 [Eumeta japonica]|uniref:Uncharacterized protein n=1 Tax=Eumeta variegata TaxID=151549 RepID=A0A4C1YHI6_EUMVA|nr:hypothetical protein EVAR_61997_1 [Eumeta japonica]
MRNNLVRCPAGARGGPRSSRRRSSLISSDFLRVIASVFVISGRCPNAPAAVALGVFSRFDRLDVRARFTLLSLIGPVSPRPGPFLKRPRAVGPRLRRAYGNG